MSSFDTKHSFFLFETTYGKKKLLHGADARDALDIARIRLSEDEMRTIHVDRYVKIRQSDLLNHIDDLG